MPKIKERKYISDAQLIHEYIKLFESGNTDNTNTYEQIRIKYKIAKERHVKFYHKTMSEWQESKEIAVRSQIQANAQEGLKSGLKSKIERQAKIQKQIEDLEYELSAGIMITHTFVEGQLIEGRRAMNGLERSQIHRTIKELHSELSKMGGDYAPIKQANTDVDGNNVPPPIILQPIQVNQLIMSDTTDVPLIEGEENSEHI